LQLFTIGLMGGVVLGGTSADPVAGAAGFSFRGPPNTGAHTPSAQRTTMMDKNRVLTA
jgi:hypothetical protein